MISVVEEWYPDSKLWEELFLVELDPQLGVADHEEVRVVHEGFVSLAFAQGVEAAFLKIEQERTFAVLI